MKKRILSIFMLCAMLLGTFSVSISAAMTEVRSSLGAKTVRTVSATSETSETTTKKKIDYVNSRFGTDGSSSMTIGPNRPNASVLPGPDTYPSSYVTGYLPGKPITGFSQIHVSAGEPNYGHFLITPQTGLYTKLDSHDFEYTDETPTAAYYSVTLIDNNENNIGVAFTPTDHSIYYRFTYPKTTTEDKTKAATIVLDVAQCFNLHGCNAEATSIEIKDDGNGNTIITGSAKFPKSVRDYTISFYAVVNKTADSMGTYIGDTQSAETSFEGRKITDDIWTCKDGVAGTRVGTGCYMQFATEENETVELKIGVSFNGIETAKEYLEKEIGTKTYEETKNETIDVWEEKLSVLTVSDSATEEQKQMFYTTLYNCFVMPRDRTGEFTDKYGDAVMTDDHIATWDTFRTLYPLYALIDQDFYAKTINSYITRQEKNGMVRDLFNGGTERARNQGGDNIDNIIAEAILKGLDGFDYEDAYAVMKYNADYLRDDISTWTVDLTPLTSGSRKSAYITRGYLAADVSNEWVMSCNKTLEYAYNDYLTGKVAEKLSQDESISAEKRAEYAADAAKYLEKGNNWQKLWNSDTEAAGFKGYIMPKNSDGSWYDTSTGRTPDGSTVFEGPLSSNGSWSNFFYECTGYSYSFFVPQDVETLIEYMGGEKTFIERLNYGINSNLIDIGNQPGFLQASFFNYTSEPWRTTDAMQKILQRFTLDKTPGCDDSGSLCAWYLWATIGLFPNAGQNLYYLTSPHYDKTVFNLGGGKTLTIKAENLSDTNKYIQSVSINGKLYLGTTVTQEQITSQTNNEIVYIMGDAPVDYTDQSVANGTLTSGQVWTLSSKGILTTSGSGDTTLANDGGAPWAAYKAQVKKVFIGSGVTAISAELFSDLPNVTEIIIPSSLTDLSASRIFADCPKLTKLTLNGNEDTIIDLSSVSSVSADLFMDSSAGLDISVKVGNMASFAPEKWFNTQTNVTLTVTAGTAADEWALAVKNGTSDTRADGYKFNLKTLARTSSGQTSNGTYSWSLNTDTGILEFKNLKPNEWNEISFKNSTGHELNAFYEWVKDWKDDIKHIVIPTFDKFSVASGSSSPFKNLKNLETVKIDTVRWANFGAEYGYATDFFAGCSSLTSLGTSKTFEEGKVKLAGFDIESLGDTANPNNVFKDCTSIKYIDFTGFSVRSKDNESYKKDLIIGKNMLAGCTSLEKVNLTGVTGIDAEAFTGCGLKSITIPDSVTTIAADAFKDCTALEEVTLKTTSFTTDLMVKESFPDRDGLVIYCQNKDVVTAVKALGYTKTIAVNINATSDAGLTLDGFSIRLTSYNGLRTEFTFDNTLIAKNKDEGIELVEYGAIVASEANATAYTTALEQNASGEFVTKNSKVVKRAVYKNGGIVDKTLSSTDTETRFAVAVVKYDDHYTDNVCTLGYSIWKLGSKYIINYVECDNEDFRATSIYDVTLGMYKDGFVNAKDDPDGVVWGVLEACAATITSGTDYRAGDYDLDGKAFGDTIKAVDLPIAKTTGGSKVSASDGYAELVHTIIEGQTFTILPDGKEYVVVIRGTGALPSLNMWGSPECLGQFNAKFNSYYYKGWNAGNRPAAVLYNAEGEKVGYVNESGQYIKIGTDSEALDASALQRRQPTPTFTSSFLGKLTTFIIDEGITSIGESFFAEPTNSCFSMKTLVYAQSVTTTGGRALAWQKKLSTIIRASNGTSSEKPETGLMDLTGFTSFGYATLHETAQNITGTVKVLLPKNVSIPNEMFEEPNSKFISFSTSKDTLVDGVADLRGIKSVGSKGLGSNLITKVYLDDSITKIDDNGFYYETPITKRTFFTAGENVAVVKNYVAKDPDNKTYVGGKSFEEAVAYTAE